jgi:hypothetical protein
VWWDDIEERLLSGLYDLLLRLDIDARMESVMVLNIDKHVRHKLNLVMDL